jgi:hypothetical protein
MHYLAEVKKWLGEITEIALLLIALAIVIEILFGTAFFFDGVVVNLTGLIKGLGDSGLAGLIALSVILYLFHRKKAATQG